MHTPRSLARLATAAVVASFLLPAWPALAAADTTPPVVTNLAPLTITRNVATTFSAHYTDNSAGVASCTLLINSFIQGEGAMTLSVPTGNTGDASQSYTYTGALSTITARVRCTDQAGNEGTTATTNVTVQDSASIGTVSPATATAGSVTNFSATITDASGLYNTCGLYIGTFNFASLSRSGSSLTGSYTFATADNYSVHAECAKSTDPSQKVVSPTTSLTVSEAGGGDPLAVMGTLSPTSATAGVSTAFSTTVTDASVKWTVCALYVGGSNVATLTRSGSSVTGSYTFASAGSYQAYARCQRNDEPAQPVDTATITVTVTAAGGGADTTAPVIASLNPTTATDVLPVSMIADVSDNVAPESCTLTVGGVLQGAMTMSVSALGPTIRQASRIHLFSTIGANTVEVRCLDAAGNVGTLTRTVTVSAAGTPPPPPAPTSTDTDSDGLTNTEEATLGTSASNRDTDGDQLSDYEEVRVYHSDPLRRDTDGDGYNDGEEVRNGYSPTGPGTLSGTTPTTGTLIKMPCPVGAGVNHACKAVYFYGRDGKRHPFPHEKTYFSWYPNFGSVQNVSEAVMSSLPLGTNVTYRPGVRLVKFQTLNTVYAVTRGGTLRAISSESVAVAIYGTAWNRQVDDIGDAFFSNYTFGTDITQANQYVPLTETASVLSIDDNF